MRPLLPATIFAAAALTPTWAQSAGPRLLGVIELPGVEGRIDHLAFDPSAQRLYVAALGHNTVEVLDVRSGSHVKSLAGFREPQGIAALPDPHVVAVANGEGEGLQILDPADYRILRSVALGDDADNVRYDPVAKRLYVGYGTGAIAAIDPATGAIVGRATLAGHPESFQLERSGPRIFVNVPSAGHIAVVDRTAMKVVATWPVTAAGSNYPMALDDANHRLFVGCRRPARVLAYDTQKGTLLGSTESVGDTDDLFFDQQQGRLYVSGGEGFLDVLDARDAAHLTRLTRTATAPGARTSLFTPDTGRLYLAVPHRGNQRAEVRVYAMRQ